MTLDEIKELYSVVEMETGIYCGKMTANNATGVKLADSVFRRNLDGALSKTKFMGDVSIPAGRIYFVANSIQDKRVLMTIKSALIEAGVI